MVCRASNGRCGKSGHPERLMEAYPISRKVNSAQHDSPDLIEPLQE
jgi:hypothetical protein